MSLSMDTSTTREARSETALTTALRDAQATYEFGPMTQEKITPWFVFAHDTSTSNLAYSRLGIEEVDWWFGDFESGLPGPQIYGLSRLSTTAAHVVAQAATPIRRITLAEARQVAIRALFDAEARRQEERDREAAFWAALDDET